MRITRDPNDLTGSLRLKFFLAGCLGIELLAIGVAIAHRFAPTLALGFLLGGLSLFASIPYLVVVRTRRGAVVGGFALAVAMVSAMLWAVAGGTRDPLEALYVPVVAFWTAVAATVLELLIFRGSVD